MLSTSHIQNALIVALVTSLVYFVLRAIYRVTVHPLARFPGPKSRAISHLPQALASRKGREPHQVLALHKRYGPVVRVNPDTISFTAVGAWKDIYSHQAAQKFQKSNVHFLRPGVNDMLAACGDDHARQRVAINHAFSEKALRSQEPLIQEYIDKLMKRLQECADQSNATVDVVKLFEFTAFDIIGDLAFSTKFGCLESNEYHMWVRTLMNFFRAVAYVLNAKLFGPLLMPIFMIFAPMQDLKGGKMHLQMAAEKVQERLSRRDESSINDFWTFILRSKEQKDAHAMSVAEMEVNASIFLPAGTETIATALSGTVWYLSKNPNVLKRLRSEIDTAFSRENLITRSSTATLPYLKAVLEECLRICPPFAVMSRRESPKEGAAVQGWWVPGGFSVNISTLAAARSPLNFNRPDEFVPERWLPLTSAEFPKWAESDVRDACQPFGFGPKNCVGRPLAYAELQLVIARLVWRFEWELQDDEFEPDLQPVHIVREKPALRLSIRSRKPTVNIWSISHTACSSSLGQGSRYRIEAIGDKACSNRNQDPREEATFK